MTRLLLSEATRKRLVRIGKRCGVDNPIDVLRTAIDFYDALTSEFDRAVKAVKPRQAKNGARR